MKDISFFSENTYLIIPNKSNPKVILAIGKGSVVKNSFKIYNPFSLKAKIFKSILSVFFINFNKILIKLFNFDVYENSEFILFLNSALKKTFTASIYNSTLKDKVVIQLQANDEIYGYVKFPLNRIGIKNIKNEINAIEILSKKKIVHLQIQSLMFKGTPFFILSELRGHIKNISGKDILGILELYKKNESFRLSNHPRIHEIKDSFIKNNQKKELEILKKCVKNSNEFYKEVYEHGDFAPWNILQTKDGFSLIDFEYFNENGLEYFDLIKFHFQVGRLLLGKNGDDLYAYLIDKISINEIKEMVLLFLLKEIMFSKQQERECQFEEEMLKTIND
jgi:hypothetical protein